MVTITNYHHIGGLKKHTFILSSSGHHQKSEVSVTGLKSRAMPTPETLGKNQFPCFLPFSRAAFFAFLSTWPLPPPSKPAEQHLASMIILASSAIKSPSTSLF